MKGQGRWFRVETAGPITQRLYAPAPAPPAATDATTIIPLQLRAHNERVEVKMEGGRELVELRSRSGYCFVPGKKRCRNQKTISGAS